MWLPSQLATEEAFLCLLTQLLAVLSASSHHVTPKAVLRYNPHHYRTLSKYYAGERDVVNAGSEMMIRIMSKMNGG